MLVTTHDRRAEDLRADLRADPRRAGQLDDRARRYFAYLNFFQKAQRRLRLGDLDRADADHHRGDGRLPPAAEPQRATIGAGPVTTTADVRETPSRPPRARRPDTTRAASYVVLGALVAFTLLMISPFLLIVAQRVQDGRATTRRTARWPCRRTGPAQASPTVWQRVDFGQQAGQQPRRQLHRGRPRRGRCRCSTPTRSASAGCKGRVWFLVFFLVANLLPQEGLVYPLYYLAKKAYLYDSPLVDHHHLHGDPERLRHLPAVVGLPRVPAGAARGRADRRRGQAAHPVADRRARQPADAGGAVHVLLHLDLERVLPAAGLPRLQLDKQTVPVALAVLQGDRLVDATTQSASALLGIVPAVIFFLIFQRTLTRGIAAGAVK